MQGRARWEAWWFGQTSGSPQEDLCGESLVCLALCAGVPPTQAVSGRTGGPGSISRVLGLGTTTT